MIDCNSKHSIKKIWAIQLMIEKKDLIDVANVTMPFGKYQGKRIIDLPEDYLLWFCRKGLPNGRLGQLMELALEVKINGQENILNPLKK